MSDDFSSLSIQNQDGTRPAVQISNTPATAKGLPALAVVQADPSGPAIYTNSAGTLLDLRNVAGVQQFKVDQSGNVTAAGTLTATAGIVGAPGTSAAQPSAAIAQTIPWYYVTSSTVAVASGTLYLHAVTLPAGVPVSNITFTMGGTSASSITHAWYALVNSALLQVAHTADQTSGGMTASTDVTKALVTPYTPAATAVYYLGMCVVASVQPTAVGSASVMGGSMFTAHAGYGTSSTGLTGPGTDASTTYSALSSIGPMYAYAT